MEVMMAFGESKTLIDWLVGDSRVNPELTMDVLKKRSKRLWVGEVALTTPVIKGGSDICMAHSNNVGLSNPY